MTKVDLKAKPYHLSDSDIQWVQDTINSMTIEEKIGQLFVNMGASRTEEYLTDIADAIRGQTGKGYEVHQTEVLKSHPDIAYYDHVVLGFKDANNNGVYGTTIPDGWNYFVYTVPEGTVKTVIHGTLVTGSNSYFCIVAGEQQTPPTEGILFDDSGLSHLNQYAVDFTTTEKQFTLCLNQDSIGSHEFLLNIDFCFIDTITPEEMATEIESMSLLDPSLLKFTGNELSYKFYNGKWDNFVTTYGDKIITENITHCPSAFYETNLTKIPFVINFKNETSTCDGNDMFNGADFLEEVPVMKGNWRPGNLHNMFKNCKMLREFPEGFAEDWDWSRHTTQTSGYAGNKSEMFVNCYSLRKLPMGLFKYGNPVLNYSYHPLRSMTNLYALDEIVDMPYPHTVACKGTGYSSFFYQPFENFHRLKTFTFAPDIGVKEWANQVLDFTLDVGYAPQYNDYTKFKYNAGVEMAAEIKDDASYQLYKDNPNAWVSKQAYSRYNHDSAVATINSLPDCSVYAAANGNNTIKFEGASGELTDGGAINTLTDAEIAVAAAKGWTVTLQ